MNLNLPLVINKLILSEIMNWHRSLELGYQQANIISSLLMRWFRQTMKFQDYYFFQAQGNQIFIALRNPTAEEQRMGVQYKSWQVLKHNVSIFVNF